MAVSNALSTSNAKEMYEGRAAYQKAFPKKSIQFDTGYENRLFGKVDTLGNVVQLNESYLSFFGTTYDVGNVSCINFMADAFRDCRRKYDLAVTKNKINFASPYFKRNLIVYDSWKQHEILFNDNLTRIYAEFINYLFDNSIKVTTFEFFVENLLIFLKEKELYITKVGFFESIENPIHTSGLALDLYLSDAGSDAKKEDFINDPNYGFLSDLLADHGLRFDAQVPWRVIANISSDKLRPYIEKYLTPDFVLQDIFNKFYFKIFESINFKAFHDYKTTIKSLYNEYKAIFPKQNIFVTNATPNIALFNSSAIAFNNPCAVKNKFVFAENIKLEPDSNEENLFFLDLYYKMRVYETKSGFSNSIQKFHRDNYQSIYRSNKNKKQDATKKALSYINYNIGTLAYRSPSVKEINLTRQGNSSKM